ncbi:MAG: hypothetical protein D3917_21075, partial [Candidatus Electrothrix sp. AX5]|nr:hypothetical protein [Candidatus Electrothrix sp. AX5]
SSSLLTKIRSFSGRMFMDKSSSNLIDCFISYQSRTTLTHPARLHVVSETEAGYIRLLSF